MHAAVVSTGKTPGCTVLAAVLAATAAQAGHEALLVELDPAGGDLAARWGRTVNPGTLTLTSAAGANGTATVADVVEHAQPCPYGGTVLFAPPSGEAASMSALELGARWGLVLSELGGVVVSDMGRWSPRQPEAARVRSAGVVFALVGADVAGVDRARTDLPELCRAVAPANVRAVVVGGPFSVEEVAGELRHVEFVGELPWEPKLARAVLDGYWSARHARSLLGRTGELLLRSAVGDARRPQPEVLG